MLLKRLILLNLIYFLINIPSSYCDCGCSGTSRNTQKGSSENEPTNTEKWKSAKDYEKMSLIPGGKYFVGTNNQVFELDKEGPEREVEVKQFYLDKYAVSNADFKEFTDTTGYKTEAEGFGDSFVFKNLLSEEVQEKYIDYRVAQAPWWYKINGTDWRHPEGPESNIDDRMDHPVIHVSWNDAVKYCAWKNKRFEPKEIL